MQGSLALARGALYVGVHAKTARVRTFDLGGRELGPSFSFRDPLVGRSAVSGLALDEDRSLLVADSPCDRVRRFSLFGREVGGMGGPAAEPGPALLPGTIRRPVDVEVQGNCDQGWIAVACAGEGRHVLQLFEPDFSHRRSCLSLGEPGGTFRGISRVAVRGDLLFVAEGRARRVQVLRSGEFLFAFQLTNARGERYEPSALAPLSDGRAVVACRQPESALFLVDGSGRPLRHLVGEGAEEGRVLEPTDVAVEEGREDRRARLFVIDLAGTRVQVLDLEGRALGSIPLVDALSGRRRKPRPQRGEG